MTMIEDDDTEEVVSSLEQGVKSIEQLLEPFLARPITELTDSMDPTTVAKMNVMLAYTLNSLYYAFLRTRGQNPNEHAVKKELERVRSYHQKVKDATEKAEPQMKLNVDAANRFISSALASNNFTNEEKKDTQEQSKESNSDSKKTKSGKKTNLQQKDTLESRNKKKQKK